MPSTLYKNTKLSMKYIVPIIKMILQECQYVFTIILESMRATLQYYNGEETDIFKNKSRFINKQI